MTGKRARAGDEAEDGTLSGEEPDAPIGRPLRVPDSERHGKTKALRKTASLGYGRSD